MQSCPENYSLKLRKSYIVQVQKEKASKEIYLCED